MTHALAIPGLSIVICTMRRSPYLADTLRSVLAQTYADWELLLLESGLDSGVGDIDFPPEKLRRIRTAPESFCAARNRGVSEARGALIAFLDDDDRWLPAKLATQVDRMTACPDIGMSHTQYRSIDGAGQVLGAGSACATNYEDMLAGDWLAHSSSMVYRRDAILQVGGSDPRYGGCGDMDLMFKTARNWRICFIPEVLSEYRVYDGNSSRDIRFSQYREARGILRSHRRHAADTANRRWFALASEGIDDLSRHYAEGAARALKDALARRRLRQAIRQASIFAAIGAMRAFDTVW